MMNKVFRSNIRMIGYTASRNRDKIIKIATIVASTGGVAAYSLAHTFYMYKYREIFSIYDMSIGEPAELSPELKKLTDEVMEEAHIPKKYKFYKMVSFFPVVGMEMFSAGSLESSYGCTIGLPFCFNYKSVKDVKIEEIAVAGRPSDVKWNSEAGRKLLESLVLSEKAKKFAIAREIHLSNTFRVHLNSIAIAVSIMLSGIAGTEMHTYWRLERKPFLTKFFVYIGGLLSGVLLWCAYHDFMNWRWQLRADECAVMQGKEYYEGALEFYQKTRDRNKAIHELFGELGAKTFTKDGDVRSIRKKYIPYRVRIAHINAAASKIVEEEDEEEEEV